MTITMMKGNSKATFEQLAPNGYKITHYAFLTCRNNWWRSSSQEVSQETGDEMIERLERKGWV